MEERMRILKMLEEGKINAEEAEKLLQSIEKKVPAVKGCCTVSTGKGKKLKIRVEPKEGGKEKVNVSIPLSLAKLVTNFIPKEQQKEMEASGVDLDTILAHVEELEATGEDIVNVDSENEKVRIYIE